MLAPRYSAPPTLCASHSATGRVGPRRHAERAPDSVHRPASDTRTPAARIRRAAARPMSAVKTTMNPLPTARRRRPQPLHDLSQGRSRTAGPRRSGHGPKTRGRSGQATRVGSVSSDQSQTTRRRDTHAQDDPASAYALPHAAVGQPRAAGRQDQHAWPPAARHYQLGPGIVGSRRGRSAGPGPSL